MKKYILQRGCTLDFSNGDSPTFQTAEEAFGVLRLIADGIAQTRHFSRINGPDGKHVLIAQNPETRDFVIILCRTEGDASLLVATPSEVAGASGVPEDVLEPLLNDKSPRDPDDESASETSPRDRIFAATDGNTLYLMDSVHRFSDYKTAARRLFALCGALRGSEHTKFVCLKRQGVRLAYTPTPDGAEFFVVRQFLDKETAVAGVMTREELLAICPEALEGQELSSAPASGSVH